MVYIPKIGSNITLDALIEFGTESELSGSGASDVANMMIKKEDVEKPVYGDKIVVNGYYWVVYRILWGNPGTHYLELRKDLRGKL